MTIKILTMFSAILVSGFLSVSTHAAFIGFEGLAPGEVVTNQYAGVIFSSIPGIDNHVSFTPHIAFGDNALCSGPYAISGGCRNDTVLTFSSFVDNLTFWAIGVNDLGPLAAIDVYEDNALSATLNVVGLGDSTTPQFVDLSSFSAVSMIRLHSISDFAGIGWDDFTFDPRPTSVALPGSGTLLALGMLSMFLQRRGSLQKECATFQERKYWAA